jgi:solute carrier family 6 amino acid transporter-like protein 5/7/9/14
MSSGFDEPGAVVWQLALCLALTWGLIFFVLIRGISSLGKVVYFTSTFPYILLTIMLVRGVTLEGAGTGIEFYLKPDWSRLGEMQVWVDASTQIFYALSTCSGGLIAMASYNQFNNNTLRDSLIVPIVNICTSIYAGFVIFSVLGYMADQKGVTVDKVAASGPGLVFVVYPEGLSTMPGAPVWSVLFFIMMMMLGLSSMFSMAETFFVAFMDEFPNILRKTYYRTVAFRAIGCTCFYLISLPMVTQGGFYIFTIWDAYTGGFPLLIIGFVEIMTVMYIYGYKNFAEDVEMMLGRSPGIVFRAAWTVVTPLVVFAIIIFTGLNYAPPILFAGSADEYEFDAGSTAVGWLIVAFCLLVIPIYFIQHLVRAAGWKFWKWRFSTIRKESLPLDSWGPHDKRNRTGRYAKPAATNGQQPTLFSSANENNGADNPGFQADDGGVTSAEGNVEMQTF